MHASKPADLVTKNGQNVRGRPQSTSQSRYFWPILTPSPCHTSQDPPKVRHTSRTTPSIFSRPSTKNPDKSPCTNSLSIVRRGFCPRGIVRGLLSGRFCPGWFLPVPPSVRIQLLQRKVKHHFKFHVSYV